jgi:hypothetical protein
MREEREERIEIEIKEETRLGLTEYHVEPRGKEGAGMLANRYLESALFPLPEI